MNKKGFTLIELLAVIVVLAIIALVAVPIILNVVEKSKKSSAESSAYGYLDALEKYVSLHEVDNVKYPYNIKNGTYKVEEEVSGVPGLNTFIVIKGDLPTSGEVILNKKGLVINAKLVINGYVVECQNNVCKVTGTDNGNQITIRYDADGGTLSSLSEVIKKGQTVTLPTPIKEGYEFNKWCLQDNTEVTNETVFTESTILYAKYLKKELAISNKNMTTLYINSPIVIETTKKNISENISWISSDTNVATISNNGIAVAKNTGTVTFTVTAGGLSDSITLSVEGPFTGIKYTQIKIDNPSNGFDNKPIDKNAYLKYTYQNGSRVKDETCGYSSTLGEICLNNASVNTSIQSIKTYFGYDEETWTKISTSNWQEHRYKSPDGTIECLNYVDTLYMYCKGHDIYAHASKTNNSTEIIIVKDDVNKYRCQSNVSPACFDD